MRQTEKSNTLLIRRQDEEMQKFQIKTDKQLRELKTENTNLRQEIQNLRQRIQVQDDEIQLIRRQNKSRPGSRVPNLGQKRKSSPLSSKLSQKMADPNSFRKRALEGINRFKKGQRSKKNLTQLTEPKSSQREDSPWTKIVNTRREAFKSKEKSSRSNPENGKCLLERGASVGGGLILVKRKKKGAKSKSPLLKGTFEIRKRPRNNLKSSLQVRKTTPKHKLYLTQGTKDSRSKPQRALLKHSVGLSEVVERAGRALRVIDSGVEGSVGLVDRWERKMELKNHRKVERPNKRNRKLAKLANPKTRRSGKSKQKISQHTKNNFVDKRRESNPILFNRQDSNSKNFRYEIKKFKKQFETEKDRLHQKLENMKESGFSEEEEELLTGIIGLGKKRSTREAEREGKFVKIPEKGKRKSKKEKGGDLKKMGDKRGNGVVGISRRKKKKRREEENDEVGVIGMEDWDFGPQAGVIGLLSNSNSEQNFKLPSKGKKMRIQKKSDKRRGNGVYSIQV